MQALNKFEGDTRAVEMEHIVQARGAHHALSELYSPPRIVPLAKRYGLKLGYSLDLTVRGPDGHFWDFSKLNYRVKLRALIARDTPYIIIGPQPCATCSQLQNISRYRPGGEERYQRSRKQAELHRVLREGLPAPDTSWSVSPPRASGNG